MKNIVPTIHTLDITISILLAVVVGYVTSFPPNIPHSIVTLYDYPFIRILLFFSVFAVALYAPLTAIIYGIGLGIISEDIIHAANSKKESFTNKDDSLKESLRIQVAKKMTPIEEALMAVKKAEHALNKTV